MTYLTVAISNKTGLIIDSYKGSEENSQNWIERTRLKYFHYSIKFNSLKKCI